MLKQIFRRFPAMLLVVSILVSLLVNFSISALAVTVDPSAVDAFNEDFNSVIKSASALDQWVDASKAVEWPYGNKYLLSSSELYYVVDWYNGNGVDGGFRGSLLNRYPFLLSAIKAIENASSELSGVPRYSLPFELQATLAQDPLNNNVWRLMTKNGVWIVDKDGNFPYCPGPELTKQDVADAIEESSLNSRYHDLVDNGKWISEPMAAKAKKINVTVDEAFFYRVAAGVIDGKANMSISSTMINGVTYRCIAYTRFDREERSIWSDSEGKPFVTPYDKAGQAVTTPFDYSQMQETTDKQTEEIKDIVDEGVQQIINDAGTKLTVPVTLFPDSDIDLSLFKELNIGEISFDFDNRSYTVNAYDIDYDVTNNYYVYNYYTYNIQYTYNNTYVTYIGSTAEYQPKEWALYYELPDGRSSADLTEEDIAGLSFQFQDIVNYERGATDTSLRALYHFDGNINDSSYFSDQGTFTWDKGASITYMESNAFNGALYLDEKEHQFTITLPSNIGTGDFSILWRYYQNSATTTDHNENMVSIGGTKVFSWSEQSMYSPGGTKLSTGLSVGTWQELAVVRENHNVYFYHNGVRISSFTSLNSSVFNNELTFYFGANSRAYSMIDELRVMDFAIAKGGAAYTPTSVPMDTNLVLVLPEAEGTPDKNILVDEYWQFDHSIEPVVFFDFSKKLYGLVTPDKSEDGTHSFSDFRGNHNWDNLQIGDYLYTADPSLLDIGDGYLSLRTWACSGKLNLPRAYAPASNRYVLLDYVAGTPYGNYPFYPLFMYTSTSRTSAYTPKSSGFSNANYYPDGVLLKGTYTMTVAYVDGTQASYTFTHDGFDSSTVTTVIPLNSSTNTFKAWLSMHVVDKNADYNHSWVQALSFFGDGCDIAYMEIVPGTVPNNHKWVQVFNTEYGEKGLPANTAAIHSDIPVKGYTVGGVRPTFPQRGDVWFPVQGSRISGVYIYNGQAWEETNARWWTGKRWIPIYAFDLITLADMWDVGSSTGDEITPSITNEYSFWNWWKQQWLDFRKWLAENLGGGGGSIIFPAPSECEHTYAEKVLTSPTCTQKGTALYFCTKCGDSYTDTIDASGHDWLMVDSIPDELDEDEEVEIPGYDLYRCSVCGEEYKDYARTGPPGEEDSSTLTELIKKLFGALGDVVGSLIDWVLDLGKEAVEGLGELGEFFEEKAEEVKGFGGEYVGFLGVFFEAIPPEIKTCLTLAVLLFGLGLFIRKVGL